MPLPTDKIKLDLSKLLPKRSVLVLKIMDFLRD